MFKRILAGIIAATCAVALLQAQEQGGGRGRGRGGAAPEQFPTAQQFAESKDAQAHVATAIKMGGSDLAAEAKAFCTATGPQRVALARPAHAFGPSTRSLEPW